VTTPAASLQIGRNVLFSQRPGQVAQTIPGLSVIRIQDEVASLTLLVKKICAQDNLTSQVIKQVAHVQWFVDTDVASVVQLVGV
jgi:hypothetical protein